MDLKSNEEMLIAMMKRTYNSDFHCSKQCFAVLLPFLYRTFSSSNQGVCLSMYFGLANNDIPLVRKFASKNLAVK